MKPHESVPVLAVAAGRHRAELDGVAVVAGVVLHHVEDPGAALRFLLRHEAAAVLFDAGDDRQAVLQALEHLRVRPQTRGVPVLVLETTPDPLLRAGARAAGLVDFLALPLDVEAAAARLELCLELRRRTRDARDEALRLDQRVRDRTADLVAEIETRQTTERRLLAHLHHLESLTALSRALESHPDPEVALDHATDRVRTLLACDRVLLVHPCSPETRMFRVAFAASRPDLTLVDQGERGVPPALAAWFGQVLAAEEALLEPTSALDETGLPPCRSQLLAAVRPKVGPAWALAVQQCGYQRVWSQDDRLLVRDIASRVSDALTHLLVHRDLQQSEERFRHLAEVLPQMVWCSEANGALSYISPQWHGYTGLSVEAAFAGGWMSALHADDLPRCRTRWADSVESGAPYEAACRLRRDDGEYRWHIVRASAQIEHGRIVRWFGTCTDIHDQLQAAESLRESKRRYQDLVDTLDGIVWECEAVSGKVTFVSHQAERILGLAPRELLDDPENWISRVHPSDRERIVQIRNAAARASKDSYHLEHRMLASDGGTVWMRNHVSVVRGDDGPTRLRGILVDITAQRIAQQRVDLQHSVSGILAEFTTLEEAGPRLLQAICAALEWDVGVLWRLEEQQGRWLDCVDLWQSEAVPFAAFVARCRQGRFPLDCGLLAEVVQRRASLWLDDWTQHPTFAGFPRADVGVGLRGAVAVPVLLGERLLGVIEFFSRHAVRRDDELLRVLAGIGSQVGQAMERRQAEDALRRTEEQFRHAQKLEAIGRLAGGVAHDFNNLLTAINGYSEVALQKLEPSAPMREPLLEIKAAGERAATLTSQLLAYSRKQVLSPRVVDLNDVVGDMERMLRRVIGEDIHLHTSLAPDLAAVRVDPGQMQQVLLNLVVNARDAMPGGGRLTIRTATIDSDGTEIEGLPAGRYVHVEVADTGKGMDADTRSHLFEPFFTTKAVGQGTGLGLSTVYGIVKQSGGHIVVDSEPDQGARFRLYLPALTVAVPRLKPQAADKLPGGDETVVVVEDEAAVRRLVTSILRSAGYRVLEAPGGEEALRLFDGQAGSGGVDLLLTDVVMPGMNGRELADRVRRLSPATSVVLMSGYTDGVGVGRGLELGSAFLQKPFTPRRLMRLVRSTLDTRRASQGLTPTPRAAGA